MSFRGPQSMPSRVRKLQRRRALATGIVAGLRDDRRRMALTLSVDLWERVGAVAAARQSGFAEAVRHLLSQALGAEEP